MYLLSLHFNIELLFLKEVTCNDFESIHNIYFHCFMSQSFLNTHMLAFLAIMCVDNGATRLLVDGVGRLNQISI